MLLSLFLIFVLIILSSSFVLRFIYEGASNVEISQYGVEAVFRAAMGDTAFSNNYYDSTDDYEYDYNYDYDYEYDYPYDQNDYFNEFNDQEFLEENPESGSNFNNYNNNGN